MILPTIVGVAETSIRAVPESYYEGSLALGATHGRSVFLLSCRRQPSGVMSGVILGVGRAIGETMAVIMIAGNQPIMPRGLLAGLRTMTANVVLEMGYASGLHRRALDCHRGGAVCVHPHHQHLLLTSETEGFQMKAVPKKDEGVFHRKGRTAAEIMATSRRQMMSSWVLTALVRLAAALSVLIVVILIGYILVTGIPPSAVGPVCLGIHHPESIYDASPGEHCLYDLADVAGGGAHWRVCAAIYLVEYAKRGNRLVKLVRLTAETLAGIPSIVYGLFGYVFFNIACGWSFRCWPAL